MRNVIKADIRRVQKKVGFIVCMAIEVALIILAGVLGKFFPLKMNGIVESTAYVAAAIFFFPLFVGIPIFSAIYSDDFKSRSMQTAIGYGMTRYKLIWARFFEGLLLLCETAVVFSIVYFITEKLLGVENSKIVKGIITDIWVRDLKILGFLCLSLIIVYGTQKPGGGLVLYILLLTGVFGTIISALDLIPFFDERDIEISKYFPSGVITSLQEAITSADTGKIILYFLAFSVCYVVVPVFISIGIFNNKELDF